MCTAQTDGEVSDWAERLRCWLSAEGWLSGEGNHGWCPHLDPISQWEAERAFVFNCS